MLILCNGWSLYFLLIDMAVMLYLFCNRSGCEQTVCDATHILQVNEIIHFTL